MGTYKVRISYFEIGMYTLARLIGTTTDVSKLSRQSRKINKACLGGYLQSMYVDFFLTLKNILTKFSHVPCKILHILQTI